MGEIRGMGNRRMMAAEQNLENQEVKIKGQKATRIKQERITETLT